MLDVYLVNLPKRIHNFSELLSIVDFDKKERIRSFTRIVDSYRTLVSDLLVKYVLSKRLDVSYKDLTFELGEYGKPFCSSHNIYYNISHSGDWVVMAVGECEVGIDIEKVKDCEYDEIVQTFFSKIEIQYYFQVPILERKNTFFDIWTLKESFIKNKGLGLSFPLDCFSIWKDEGKIFIKQDFDDNCYYFKQYDVLVNYKLSVCYREDSFPKKYQIKEIDITVLEQFFNLMIGGK